MLVCGTLIPNYVFVLQGSFHGCSWLGSMYALLKINSSLAIPWMTKRVPLDFF